MAKPFILNLRLSKWSLKESHYLPFSYVSSMMPTHQKRPSNYVAFPHAGLILAPIYHPYLIYFISSPILVGN